MKTLLMLGAGIEQVYGIKRAKEKGIHSVVLDMNADAPGKPFAGEFYPVSTRDIGAIVEFLKTYGKKIDGVMTMASDIPHCVSAAAEFLGVTHIPLSVAQTCVQKFKMKDALKAGGVNVPNYASVKTVADLQAFISRIGYPVILKPVDNSGARGVVRLSEGTDLAWAFEYSKKFAFSGDLIAEQFIEGPQVSTEGVMHENIFYCTGFADRNYENMAETAPYLVEDGGDIPTRLSPAHKKLIETEFEKGVRALGIGWGPAKGDMVMGQDGKPYIVEVAARLSGGNFCYDKVPWSTGVDIVDIVIDMAVGNAVDPKRFMPTKNFASSQRYFFPEPGVVKEIQGVERALAMPHIKKVDVWAKPGDEIPKIVNHPSRVGYVIALAPTLKEAVTAAEAAVREITFVTA